MSASLIFFALGNIGCPDTVLEHWAIRQSVWKGRGPVGAAFSGNQSPGTGDTYMTHARIGLKTGIVHVRVWFPDHFQGFAAGFPHDSRPVGHLKDIRRVCIVTAAGDACPTSTHASELS